MPNETDSIGIRIAECINNKIQARYACSAFIGVSNNLDVFVSIASTDNKKFIMTIPCTANDKQELRLKQNIGFARFLFATANNMENVKGRYLSGKIKNKIVELLDMQDNTLLYKSKRLEDMLKEGEEYRDYLKDDSDMQSIYDYRNLFRKYSIMEDEEQLPYIDEDYDEDYYTDYGIEYSVEYIEDNLEIILEETSRRLEEMKNNIIGNMTYFDGGFSVEKFEDYRECMLKVLYYDFEIEEKGDIPVVCCNMDEEMKILCASIYWVLLAVGEGEVKKEKIEELHKYMRTKNMLAYFDAINKEFDEKGETHTLLKMDSFNILEVIDEVCTKRQKYQRPIMLYIDVEAYPNITNYLDDILKGYGVIIIICDVNKTLSNYNLQILDEELDLYYAEGVYNGV
jgi:hypothetical protein